MQLKKLIATALFGITFFTSIVCIEEKEIVIVIASYKNEAWYERNLDSVTNQNYTNYRVIYINDCSPDNTGTLVAQYISNHHLTNKITLINNNVRVGALANFYRAIHSCPDSAIIVMVDGDDWLNGPNVLSRINAAYADPNVWLTYGQFQEYPNGRIGFCKDIPTHIIDENLFRKFDWLTSHPRTFYAALFKKIKLEDLLYEEKLFLVTWDLAIMFPMLEMAREHIKFIPDVLYIYNEDNPCNDFKTSLIQQLHCNYLLRGEDSYERVPTLFAANAQPLITAIIFSADPAHLATTLQSTASNVTGIDTMIVVCDAHDKNNQQKYEELQRNYPNILFIPQEQNVATMLRNLLPTQENAYVLLGRDYCAITHPVDLRACAHELMQTHAYGFYLTLGKNTHIIPGLQREMLTPALTNIWHHTYAWRFSEGEYLWRTQHSSLMALYHAIDISKKITNNDEDATCFSTLFSIFDNEKAIGLCFDEAPVAITF